ncbi:GIP [Symbiodinium sp. CCMP2592]|nr:GIP [Symbiodinium sp. CCMP2592]
MEQPSKLCKESGIWGQQSKSGDELRNDDDLVGWAFVHASMLHNAFAVHAGTTQFNMAYRGKLACFGEVVFFALNQNHVRKGKPKFVKGVWLGKTLTNDLNVCQCVRDGGTALGIYLSGTIRRMAPDQQWSKHMIKEFSGKPYRFSLSTFGKVVIPGIKEKRKPEAIEVMSAPYTLPAPEKKPEPPGDEAGSDPVSSPRPSQHATSSNRSSFLSDLVRTDKDSSSGGATSRSGRSSGPASAGMDGAEGDGSRQNEELEQVDEASQAHEVKRLVEMGVLEQVEALPLPPGAELLKTKHVIDWRLREGKWQRRARLVCKQLKIWDPNRSEDAFLTVKQRDELYVLLDGVPFRVLNRVLRCLPGQQAASAWWSEQLTEDLKEAGLVPDAACPSAFGTKGLGVMMHVDDGLNAGEDWILEKVKALLMQKYKLEVSDVAFNVGESLEEICGILDIKRLRARKTPRSAEITQPEYSEECDGEMAVKYRGAICGFLYLSPDHPDCQWTIAHLARAMSRPTVKMFKHAVHLAEYMMSTKDACQVFRWMYPGRSCLDDRVLSRSGASVLQEQHKGDADLIESVSDSDWAGHFDRAIYIKHIVRTLSSAPSRLLCKLDIEVLRLLMVMDSIRVAAGSSVMVEESGFHGLHIESVLSIRLPAWGMVVLIVMVILAFVSVIATFSNWMKMMRNTMTRVMRLVCRCLNKNIQESSHNNSRINSITGHLRWKGQLRSFIVVSLTWMAIYIMQYMSHMFAVQFGMIGCISQHVANAILLYYPASIPCEKKKSKIEWPVNREVSSALSRMDFGKEVTKIWQRLDEYVAIDNQDDCQKTEMDRNALGCRFEHPDEHSNGPMSSLLLRMNSLGIATVQNGPNECMVETAWYAMTKTERMFLTKGNWRIEWKLLPSAFENATDELVNVYDWIMLPANVGEKFFRTGKIFSCHSFHAVR